MINELVEETRVKFSNIGDAIRKVTGTTTEYTVDEMARVIEGLSNTSGNLEYIIQASEDEINATVEYKYGYSTAYFLSSNQQYNFYDSSKNKIGIGYASEYGLAYITTPIDLTNVKSIWFGGWLGINSSSDLTLSVTAGITSTLPSSVDCIYDKQQTLNTLVTASTGKTDVTRKEGSHYGLCLDVSDIVGKKYIAWSMAHGTEQAQYSAYFWLDTIALDISEIHTVVDSIITDGYSYINTGIYPSPQYSIEMECRLNTIVDDRYDFLFGTRYGDKGRWQARFDTATAGYPYRLRVQKSPYYYGSGDWYTDSSKKEDWMDYRVFKLEKNNVYIDGELLYSFASSSEKVGHYPFSLYLFAVNDADETNEDALTNCGYLDCKYVKIWDGKDELILDLIPVVKTDGTVCMYDNVNNKYYYNAGTGTFTYSVS